MFANSTNKLQVDVSPAQEENLFLVKFGPFLRNTAMDDLDLL